MRRVLIRLGLVAVGLAAGATVLEVALRATGGGVRAQVGLFQVSEGRVGLRPCAEDRVRGPDGRVTVVLTDPEGLRTMHPCERGGAGVLVLGDSQVFGLGVEAKEAFPTRLGAVNGGVPDYGLADSLAAGDTWLTHPTHTDVSTVLVVLNQANDWDDGMVPAGERNEVHRGYLFRAGRLGVAGRMFWSSPFADSALAYRLWARLNPVPRDPPGEWLTAPPTQAATSVAFASAVRTFAAKHADLRVVPVWLPADLATSEARAVESVLARGADLASLRPWSDTTLRDQVAAALGDTPLVDLTDTLRDPADFLPHDFHLSEQGHAAVGARLGEVLGG